MATGLCTGAQDPILSGRISSSGRVRDFVTLSRVLHYHVDSRYPGE